METLSLYLFQKASDDELQDMFYDKFEVTLDDVQVMIIDKSKRDIILTF